MDRSIVVIVAVGLFLAGPACNSGTPNGGSQKDASPVTHKPDTGDIIIVTPDSGTCIDNDGDGYGEGCALGPDCDDNDPEVHPGADEICGNGKDDNCDGQTDEATCGCRNGTTRECFSGPAGKAGVGICRKGLQKCDAGKWGSCKGQVLPTTEVCDGLDNDCDGVTDNGLLNACGTCGPAPAEICGDGLDNNCDGRIDEGCGTCDPGCVCAGGACTCHPPVNQPCYTGAPQTSGVGECKAGVHDCQLQADGSYSWGTCRGQVLPAAEVCGNGKDDNCDGQTDEGCKPACVPKPEVCNGKDDDCDGLTDEGVTNACGGCGDPGPEICGDGLDNNCDGQVDEGCPCNGKDEQPCYLGTKATMGKGVCKAGVQHCLGGEMPTWGPCEGAVMPSPEICGDGKDNDCDGVTDNGCLCTEGETRACGSSVGECKPGTQTCHLAAWGPCTGAVGPTPEVCDGKDNDCDGLVDNGVLNACGKCPPSPCYTEDWNDPADCTASGRTCNGVEPDKTDPNSVTLGQSTGTLLPFIYISVTNKGEVAQLNTDTGIKQWQASTYGVNPSRTAVALDGSVWVGNRCLADGRDNDFTCSSMVHLDLNGNLICRADIPGWVRAVAIDADGNAWAGTWNGQTVWRVSGTDVDDSQGPPTRCRIISNIPLGVSVYGLAIDGRGFLWTASEPTKKIEIASNTVVDTVSHGSFYGIAIDASNRVWFGGWNGSGDMHRLDPEPPHTVLHTNLMGVTAVTVHPDGSIWGSEYGGPDYGGPPYGIVKVVLDATGTQVASAQSFPDPDGSQNHGVAVDRAGKIWSPQVWLKGTVNRWLPTGIRDTRFDVDTNQGDLYTYSDMTGIQLRTITTREGHWYQDFDSGYPNPAWDHAEWTANAPAGTSATVQFRAADSEAGFNSGTATPWCGPFAASPGAFATCPFLNGHRWMQADVKLSTTQDGLRPTFSDLKLFWAH